MVVFGQKFKAHEIIAVTILLFLIIAIPLTVYLVKQQQIIKSRATGEFNVGVNIAGVTHLESADLIDAHLVEIARMGGKIVRVFAAKDSISHEEASKRLDYFLTRAQGYGISVIVAFIDFYGSGYRPQGTEGFYTDNWNGIPLLNHDFFAGGYQGSYKQFVTTIVSQNKQHSNIYAWEMGNELKDDKDPATFISFMRDISSTIKNIDPTHQIASGMLSAGHTNLSPDALYGAVPDIDIVTIHMYNGNRAGTADADWAAANGKTVIDEEAGFSGSGDRTQQMQDDINYWKSHGVSVLLQWGFMPATITDSGFGDRDSGMDTTWHTDYESLFALYQSYNGGSNQNVSPGPIASAPVSSPVSTTSVFGRVWEDLDGNQTINGSEVPLEDVKVYLDSGLTSQATNNQGYYTFSGVIPGSHLVFLDLNDLDSGNWTLTTPSSVSVSITAGSKARAAFGLRHPLSDSSPAPSPSPSAFSSPSPTPKVSPSPRLTPSPTPRKSPTPSPTPSHTPILSPTPTPSSVPSPSPSPSPTLPASQVRYDLNRDNRINSVDRGLFLINWKSGDNFPVSEFNGDGVINSIDYALLVRNFSL